MTLYDLFPDCRQKIDTAIAHAGGRYDAADIGRMILTGEMRPWRSPGCCLITEIAVYPKKRVLRVVLAAGHLPGLAALLAEAEAWAWETEGCTMVEALGRLGWAALAQRRGWRIAAVVVEKELRSEPRRVADDEDGTPCVGSGGGAAESCAGR